MHLLPLNESAGPEWWVGIGGGNIPDHVVHCSECIVLGTLGQILSEWLVGAPEVASVGVNLTVYAYHPEVSDSGLLWRLGGLRGSRKLQGGEGLLGEAAMLFYRATVTVSVIVKADATNSQPSPLSLYAGFIASLYATTESTAEGGDAVVSTQTDMLRAAVRTEYGYPNSSILRLYGGEFNISVVETEGSGDSAQSAGASQSRNLSAMVFAISLVGAALVLVGGLLALHCGYGWWSHPSEPAFSIVTEKTVLDPPEHTRTHGTRWFSQPSGPAFSIVTEKTVLDPPEHTRTHGTRWFSQPSEPAFSIVTEKTVLGPPEHTRTHGTRWFSQPSEPAFSIVTEKTVLGPPEHTRTRSVSGSQSQLGLATTEEESALPSYFKKYANHPCSVARAENFKSKLRVGSTVGSGLGYGFRERKGLVTMPNPIFSKSAKSTAAVIANTHRDPTTRGNENKADSVGSVDRRPGSGSGSGRSNMEAERVQFLIERDADAVADADAVGDAVGVGVVVGVGVGVGGTAQIDCGPPASRSVRPPSTCRLGGASIVNNDVVMLLQNHTLSKTSTRNPSNSHTQC